MRKHSYTLPSALLLMAALLGAGSSSFLGLAAASAGLSIKNITIRLASGDDMAGAGDGGWDVPPWKCCDVPACTTRDIPPRCFCADLVDTCDGCEDCVAAAAGSRYMCADRYRTYPPPPCTEPAEKPWPCCDDPRCTLTCPTICHCDDAVESCAAACRDCRQVEDAPPRYRCIDAYAGSPWPRCNA